MNETISMKNLFRIESFMEACISNHSYAALSNSMEYIANRTHSLNSILEHSKFIIGINDFCYWKYLAATLAFFLLLLVL